MSDLHLLVFNRFVAAQARKEGKMTFDEKQSDYSRMDETEEDRREAAYKAGWQACEAQMPERVRELEAKLSDLEDIDKVADHANEIIGKMQADYDALEAQTDERVRAAVESERKRVLEEAIKVVTGLEGWYDDRDEIIIELRALAASDTEEK